MCVGGEDMNERIKKIRNKLNMNQSEFGNKIGLGQAGVSAIEKGIRGITERNIQLICEKFDVNEEWLRTGAGGEDNMFTKLSEDDRFSLNLGKLSTTENEFIKNGINFLAETDPEKLKVLEEFMKAWLGIK